MPRKNNRAIRNLRNDMDNTGGYFGGRRGIPPDRYVPNQTTFEGPGSLDDRYPVLPPPQPILKMPKQLAKGTDKSNTKGKIASTQNLPISGDANWSYVPAAETFMHDIDNVYINPLYQNEYIKPAGSADTKERRSMEWDTVRKGIDQFAQANTKYFEKKFKVLPYPHKQSEMNFGGDQPNPMRTLMINIEGENEPRGNWAGLGRFGFKGPSTKGRGSDSTQPDSVQKSLMILNSKYSYQDPGTWAHIVQHEFGHNLGLMHTDDHTGEDQNSGMSYHPTTYNRGPALFPSDINKLQEVYKRRDIRKRAKNAYKGVAKKRK